MNEHNDDASRLESEATPVSVVGKPSIGEAENSSSVSTSAATDPLEKAPTDAAQTAKDAFQMAQKSERNAEPRKSSDDDLASKPAVPDLPKEPVVTVSTAKAATNFNDLLREVINSPTIGAEHKVQFIRALASANPTSEKVLFLLAVGILGLIAITAIGCLTALLVLKVTPVPDGLIAVASAAVGGLAGLLAPKGGSSTSQ